jgi:hypothetical protein
MSDAVRYAQVWHPVEVREEYRFTMPGRSMERTWCGLHVESARERRRRRTYRDESLEPTLPMCRRCAKSY